MKMKKMSSLLLVLSLLVSAASYAEVLEIKSTPDKAEVFVRNPKTDKLSKLGTTPIKLDFDNIANNYTQSKNFVLILKKQDYEDYRVLMTKPRSSDVSLVANMGLINKAEDVRQTDVLINELFDVQRLVRSKSYDQAIQKLTTLEEKHRDISVIYEMKAMAFYMKKNINESLSYYRKAFAVNPGNKDAYTMKTYLEKELGLDRSPASK
jgi:tetratricopeptide (TPR) repeat protein